MTKRLLRKILNIPLTILILIYLILEELIWERVAEPVYRYIHSLKLLQRIEGQIHALNRYALLVVFLFLFAGVEGLGIVSLALFAQGQPVLAVVLYATKIPIAAFTFWLFRIAQDKLLTFSWFKFCYDGLLSILHKIKTSAIYLEIRAKLHSIKVKVKDFFRENSRRIKALFGYKSATNEDK